jgi:hypothetical protein
MGGVFGLPTFYLQERKNEIVSTGDSLVFSGRRLIDRCCVDDCSVYRAAHGAAAAAANVDDAGPAGLPFEDVHFPAADGLR